MDLDLDISVFFIVTQLPYLEIQATAFVHRYFSGPPIQFHPFRLLVRCIGLSSDRRLI